MSWTIDKDNKIVTTSNITFHHSNVIDIFTLCVSVVVFVRMIPVGIIVTKTATDSQNIFLKLWSNAQMGCIVCLQGLWTTYLCNTILWEKLFPYTYTWLNSWEWMMPTYLFLPGWRKRSKISDFRQFLSEVSVTVSYRNHCDRNCNWHAKG